MNIILDNGHGGIIDGKYQTAGKRSPVWEDGTQLFEGDFNRKVVNKIGELLWLHSVSHDILVPELRDISLEERVNRVHEIHEARESLLISVHANAGGGTGYEVFTSFGDTKSDEYAEIMIDEYGMCMDKLKLRKDTRDGDKDKEAQFYILKRTVCPAILIETAFMDTYEPDCRMMLEDTDQFAFAIFAGIRKILNR